MDRSKILVDHQRNAANDWAAPNVGLCPTPSHETTSPNPFHCGSHPLALGLFASCFCDTLASAIRSQIQLGFNSI